jgi:hypothetical protein
MSLQLSISKAGDIFHLIRNRGSVILVIFPLVFIFSLLGLISCSKETQSPSVVLKLRFKNTNSEVEWQEVTGNRYLNSGNLYIVANGYDSERFYLDLTNVTGAGLVHNITTKNISYENNYGFKTGSLISATVRIIEINKDRIYGSFEAEFVNISNTADFINAEGEFTILGH